ncbi:MAG: MazG nucleotide pyrophosphohydrolase domain-containing protein [Nanoarchaeota archaeon]
MDLKEAQKKVDKWFEKAGAEKWPKFVIFARLVEEIGEISKCMNVKEGYQKKEVSNLNDEFGDALFTFILLANEYDLDLNEVMEDVLEKYRKYIK